jgi:diacylglycerol kinase (ATP)
MNRFIFQAPSMNGKRNMRVTLIHNPKAGANEQTILDEILAQIRAAGHDVRCQSAQDADWDKVLGAPADLVAVAGGDGTVGAVAKLLAGRHIPIAVLPVGTANNISQVLGLADTTPDQLIAGWATARRIAFDTGTVDGPWGATRFIEGFGVGLLARAITELDGKAEVAFGRVDNREEKMESGLKRLRDLVETCPAEELKISLDGQELSGEYILMEVMNIQHIGPSLHFAPAADPGDGLIELILVKVEQREKLAEYFSSRLEGGSQPLRWGAYRGQRLQLRCEASDIHIDDKVWPAHGPVSVKGPMHFALGVDRHSLEFLV